MPRYLIALGSSHIDGPTYLQRARHALQDKKVFSLHGASRIYKNYAAITHYNSLFYNSVLAVHAPLHPHVFYRELAQIEHALGRIRPYPRARRTIDLDVLLSMDFTYKSS